MEKPIRSGLKTLFLVHAVLGIIFGLSYLIIPGIVAGWFNMPLTDESYLRVIGAAIIGYAAMSTVGYLAHSWGEVKIVVQGEFVWTGLAAILSLGFVLGGTWPVFGWVIFGLMALFFIAFGYFYWQEERTFVVPGPAARR